MLHCLHQNQSNVEFALRFAASELQILYAQSGIAVRGRHDAAIKSDRVALILNFRLQLGQAGFDFLVGCAVNLVIRLQDRNFLI